MRRLTTADEISGAKDAFDQVFRSADPFDQPFQARLAHRALLFPASRLLDIEQYNAVVHAAESIGETTAYVTAIETYAGTGFSRHPSWEIALSDIRPDAELMRQGWSGISETALYSVKGTWGALSAHELHAVIAGTPAFMQVLTTELDLDAQLQEFLAYWQDSYQERRVRIQWIPPLLTHLYGRAQAKSYLEPFGLMSM